ncbi:hypothetical protein IQ266_23060 [filamentous cyanobacterium LEGE 11480]|uniref:Uncharacterized protein n=1 Tax=Romeriopsis navalis LEGE 11480 TaxID=2777977 RepID=A0A928VRW2_9CYAN|nr:hypothetical protein [Romeriopsis navalis]MBE9032622.1 hypothetical protein [Romeriopsis navalis LEGE 11480]
MTELTTTQLCIHLPNGSVAFDFSLEAATELRSALDRLMVSLKELAAKPAGERAKPQATMEFKQRTPIFVEVFCNPNIYPTPFAAKVLLTVRSADVRISTEAELSQLIEDVNTYLA